MRPELFCHAHYALILKTSLIITIGFRYERLPASFCSNPTNIKKMWHLDKHPASVQNPMIPEKGTYGKQQNGGSEFGHGQERGLTTCKHGPTGKLQKPSQGWFDKRRKGVHSQNMAQHGNPKIDSTILEKNKVFSNYSP